MYKERMNKLSESLTDKPVYLCLYGSQNYECDLQTPDYSSDFDYKAVVVPTLKQLVFNSKPKSVTVDILEGQIDMKDVRVFFDTLMKCNPAFVECMMTEHWVGDPAFEYARELMPQFVWEMREQFIKACYGMMMEKKKALQHPYPSVVERLQKFGYDPKQLHHMVRLFQMMKDFESSDEVILVPESKEYLKDIKLGKCSLNNALELAELVAKKGLLLRNKLLDEYARQEHTYHAVNKMKQFGLEYLEKKVREEVLRNG